MLPSGTPRPSAKSNAALVAATLHLQASRPRGLLGRAGRILSVSRTNLHLSSQTRRLVRRSYKSYARKNWCYDAQSYRQSRSSQRIANRIWHRFVRCFECHTKTSRNIGIIVGQESNGLITFERRCDRFAFGSDGGANVEYRGTLLRPEIAAERKASMVGNGANWRAGWNVKGIARTAIIH